MQSIVALSKRILWLEPLILGGIALAFWYPTPTRTDWLWLLWLLVPILVARFLVHRRFLTRTPLDVVFFAFMLLGVLNVAFAPYTRGLMMLARPLLGIAMYYALVERGRESSNLRSPVQVIIMLALLVGLSGLGATQWNGKARPFSAFIDMLPLIQGSFIGGGFNANEISGAITWLLPGIAGIAVYRWQTRGIRWDVTLAFIMLFAVIIFGQSRSSIIGIVAALFLVAVLLLRDSWKWLGLLFVVSIVALEIGLYAGDFAVLSPTNGEAQNPATRETNLSRFVSTGEAPRLDIWQSALAIVSDYPIFGVGLSMFRDNRVREQYPAPAMEGRILPHAHNEYLQIMTDMGIPGLIVFLSIYLVAFWMLMQAWKSENAEIQATSVAIGAGLLAHIIFGFTDAITLWDRFSFIFWLMLGMAGAVFTMAHKLSHWPEEISEV